MFVGVLAPALAGMLAPSGASKLAAGLGTLAWLAHALWVAGNARNRWSRLRPNDSDAPATGSR